MRFIGTKYHYKQSIETLACTAREVLAEAGLYITQDDDKGGTRRLMADAGPDTPQWKNVWINISEVRPGDAVVHVIARRPIPRKDAEQTALTDVIFARMDAKLHVKR